MSETYTPGEPFFRVYIGRRLGENKIHHVWMDCTADLPPALIPLENYPSGRYFEKTPKQLGCNGAYPGAVYKYTPTKEDPQRYWTTGQHAPKFAGSFQDRTLVAQWRAEDELAQVVVDRAKRAKNQDEQTSLETLLEPLRKTYRESSYRQRRALLAVVLEILTA